MLPTPPECGTPCGLTEALAHDNARLKACLLRCDEELRARAEKIAQLRAELESVRRASARLDQARATR